MAKRYTMKLRSIGNPDFAQFAPVSDPEIVDGDTLKEMRDHAQRYITYWDLGGGNWPEPFVLENGKRIGRFSYNGRFWSPRKTKADPHGAEILV